MNIVKKFFEMFDFKNWRLVMDTADFFTGEFILNSIKYQSIIQKIDDNYDAWQIDFAKIDKNGMVYTTLTADYKQINSNKVFSNVMDIAFSFIEEKKPKLLIWKSIDNDRHFLYRKFGEVLAEKYGYTHHYLHYEGDLSKCVYYATTYSNDKTARILLNRTNLFDKLKK